MSFEEIVQEAVRKAMRDELPSLVRSAIASAPASGGGDYLTPAEAADVAKVHIDTIRLWLKEGKLPPHYSGKRKRVLRADLERLMASGPFGKDDEGPSADEIAARALAKRKGKA